MNMVDIILTHAPALLVAIPLLGAFLTPLVSKINDKIRNIFVIIILGITGILVLLVAQQVMDTGPITYVFGSSLSTVQNNTVIRILFEIDALSVFMALISIILSFVASVYSWGFLQHEQVRINITRCFC